MFQSPATSKTKDIEVLFPLTSLMITLGTGNLEYRSGGFESNILFYTKSLDSV